MKEFNKECSKLCSYQANIFSLSRKRFICSSKIFLRRFFNSNFALHLDFYERYSFSFDEEECFQELLEEYGDSTYGKIKLPESVLHYIGYITRYICYTREITTLFFYNTFGLNDLLDNYEVFHTQSEEYIIKELLVRHNLTEDIFDKEKLLKKILKAKYAYNENSLKAFQEVKEISLGKKKTRRYKTIKERKNDLKF